ncbi:MAG: DUF4419 domain-containing protein, partial [Bacteroidales bacterium]|nr:DUF4419 domain-containing protein [Bacteroidales bacterium]
MIGALHYGFAEHRPVVLSPEMVWLMIIQGFSLHIEQNAKDQRYNFVDFDGTKKIRIIGNEFLFQKGNEFSPWEEVIPKYTNELQKYISDSITNLFIHKFSNTTTHELTAFHICLLKSMSAYFNYEFYNILRHSVYFIKRQ